MVTVRPPTRIEHRDPCVASRGAVRVVLITVGLTILFVVGVIVWGLLSATSRPSANFARLIANGIPGRGILLQVSALPTGAVGTGLNRYQQRTVMIDIEIPGAPPYVVNGSLFIPMNLVRDVLPGATVEIRVDPKNPSNIVIVGPGVAFAGAAQFLAAPISDASSGRS
jgi:hypothetical protein